MARFEVDSTGSLIVRQPASDREIIQMGQTYVAYESTLPPEQQLAAPALALIVEALAAAATAETSADDSEHTRTIASQTASRAMAQIETELHWALTGRARLLRHHLVELERWGVHTVKGKRGLLARYPRRQDGWLTLLDAYIAREESLPPDEKWTDPPLATFITLRETVRTNQIQEDTALMQRMHNVSRRGRAASRLKMLLDLALHNLIVLRHEGKVDLNLTRWGYNIIHRPAKNGRDKKETAVVAAANGAGPKNGHSEP